MAKKEKILISVKTYPTLSRSYGELVCTAGFREDGSWVRIYPVPFRNLKEYQKYKKFQWIDVGLVKSDKDPRPESFKVVDFKEIRPGKWISPDQSELRRRYALKRVFTNLKQIIEAAKRNELSLATFRPTKYIKFEWEEVEREWEPSKVAEIKRDRLQMDFFQGPDKKFKLVDKLPYKFFYIFEDDKGKRSRMMIEEWEVGMLYRNCLKQHEGNEAKACEGVKKKYWDEMVLKRDTYLFLGTTREFHARAKNPFIIIGVWPLAKGPAQTMLELE